MDRNGGGVTTRKGGDGCFADKFGLIRWRLKLVFARVGSLEI